MRPSRTVHLSLVVGSASQNFASGSRRWVPGESHQHIDPMNENEISSEGKLRTGFPLVDFGSDCRPSHAVSNTAGGNMFDGAFFDLRWRPSPTSSHGRQILGQRAAVYIVPFSHDTHPSCMFRSDRPRLVTGTIGQPGPSDGIPAAASICQPTHGFAASARMRRPAVWSDLWSTLTESKGHMRIRPSPDAVGDSQAESRVAHGAPSYEALAVACLASVGRRMRCQFWLKLGPLRTPRKHCRSVEPCFVLGTSSAGCVMGVSDSDATRHDILTRPSVIHRRQCARTRGPLTVSKHMRLGFAGHRRNQVQFDVEHAPSANATRCPITRFAHQGAVLPHGYCHPAVSFDHQFVLTAACVV